MKPGDDPIVLTVGAYNDKGTSKLDDDSHVEWSSVGPTAQGLVKPDVVAPGRSLTLVRSLGSKIEVDNPKGLVSPSYIRGSGTSQAAAVTSGLAALLVAARPNLTPDQVKHLLRSTAMPLADKTANQQGTGRVRLAPALTADAGPAYSQNPTATGLGSLEAARGGYNVYAYCNDVETLIQGEIDVMCEAWDPKPWVGSSWRGDAWTGSSWRGAEWTGSSWRGLDWSSATWDGSSWRDGTWTGSSWRSHAWTGSTWEGSSWRGSSWRGSSWRGSSWRSSTWSDSGFSSSTYDDDVSSDELFLSAFFGHNPPWHKKFPGETSDPAPLAITLDECVKKQTKANVMKFACA
jgi:serine protease AprX